MLGHNLIHDQRLLLNLQILLWVKIPAFAILHHELTGLIVRLMYMDRDDDNLFLVNGLWHRFEFALIRLLLNWINFTSVRDINPFNLILGSSLSLFSFQGFFRGFSVILRNKVLFSMLYFLLGLVVKVIDLVNFIFLDLTHLFILTLCMYRIAISNPSEMVHAEFIALDLSSFFILRIVQFFPFVYHIWLGELE